MYLHTHKTAAMQTIQNAARHGYTQVASGIVEADRLVDFVTRMEKKLNLDRSRQAVFKDRQRGRVVAKLVIYPAQEEAHPTGFCWWLIATGLIEGERLDDITKVHLSFRDEYELVRLNRKGQDKASWTWRLKADLLAYWFDRLHRAITQKNDGDLRQCIYSLKRMPGFSGIRKDRSKLWGQIKADWRRNRKSSEEMPTLPVNNFKKSVKVIYVVRLGQFVAEMKRCDRTAEGQLRAYLGNRAPIARRRAADARKAAPADSEKSTGLLKRIGFKR